MHTVVSTTVRESDVSQVGALLRDESRVGADASYVTANPTALFSSLKRC